MQLLGEVVNQIVNGELCDRVIHGWLSWFRPDMPQHKPLFQILSRNFVCVYTHTCFVDIKTIGR